MKLFPCESKIWWILLLNSRIFHCRFQVNRNFDQIWIKLEIFQYRSYVNRNSKSELRIFYKVAFMCDKIWRILLLKFMLNSRIFHLGSKWTKILIEFDFNSRIFNKDSMWIEILSQSWEFLREVAFICHKIFKNLFF